MGTGDQKDQLGLEAWCFQLPLHSPEMEEGLEMEFMINPINVMKPS